MRGAHAEKIVSSMSVMTDFSCVAHFAEAIPFSGTEETKACIE